MIYRLVMTSLVFIFIVSLLTFCVSVVVILASPDILDALASVNQAIDGQLSPGIVIARGATATQLAQIATATSYPQHLTAQSAHVTVTAEMQTREAESESLSTLRVQLTSVHHSVTPTPPGFSSRAPVLAGKIAFERDGRIYLKDFETNQESFLINGEMPQWLWFEYKLYVVYLTPKSNLQAIRADGLEDIIELGETNSFTGTVSGAALMIRSPQGFTKLWETDNGLTTQDYYYEGVVNYGLDTNGARLALYNPVKGKNSGFQILNLDNLSFESLFPSVNSIVVNSMQDMHWSPDGRLIAFSSNIDGDLDIYTVDIESQDVMRLTDNTDIQDFSPSWSPDGKMIAFVSTRSGNYDIYVINADGTYPVQITTDKSNEYAPTWQPWPLPISR